MTAEMSPVCHRTRFIEVKFLHFYGEIKREFSCPAILPSEVAVRHVVYCAENNQEFTFFSLLASIFTFDTL